MESKLNNFLIGSFVPTSKPKYLLEALDTAIDCKENCFMIYTGSPQSFIRTNINEMKINEFQKGCVENNINIDNVIVHAPYIINLATNEVSKRKFTLEFLTKEVDRVNKIGCKYLVVHPGNATNGITVLEAIQNCANILNEINKTNKNVVLCLETMSGKGTEIGKTFDELKQIITLVKNKALVGVCIDTCHTWDQGYNWTNTDKIYKEFDNIVGLEYLKCLHINDSLNDCGAKKDRHANIGYGKIGFKTIIDICYHRVAMNLPKVLETPVYGSFEETYKTEIQMLRDKRFINWIK